MTVEEAVQLVIQAGAIGECGHALILDMGTPVRIADVARQLIASAPRPVEIVYTGLRPGEKLHEVLLGADERPVPTVHSSITSVSVPPMDLKELDAADDDPEGLIAELADVACRRWRAGAAECRSRWAKGTRVPTARGRPGRPAARSTRRTTSRHGSAQRTPMRAVERRRHAHRPDPARRRRPRASPPLPRRRPEPWGGDIEDLPWLVEPVAR